MYLELSLLPRQELKAAEACAAEKERKQTQDEASDRKLV
jgi:hypothetical protein